MINYTNYRKFSNFNGNRPYSHEMLVRILMNGLIPVIVCELAKNFTTLPMALILSAATPIVYAIYSLVRYHRLQPMSLLVLANIAASVALCLMFK